MKPVSPVIPDTQAADCVIAKDQPPYQPLPVRRIGDGAVLSRWALSEDELSLVARLRYLHLYQWTFDRKRQAAQVLVSPVTDADELLPPEGVMAYGEGAGVMRTRWWFTEGELEQVLRSRHVYLVVWQGDQLLQPVCLDVNTSARYAPV